MFRWAGGDSWAVLLGWLGVSRLWKGCIGCRLDVGERSKEGWNWTVCVDVSAEVVWS